MASTNSSGDHNDINVIIQSAWNNTWNVIAKKSWSLPWSNCTCGEDQLSAYKNAKVLITGGLGFIGSNLARSLVAQGANVTLVDS